MIERELDVVAVEDGAVRLAPAAACRGCAGCGGRCALLSGERALILPPARFPQPPAVGQRWMIGLTPAALSRSAWRVYARALAGIVLGAVTGHLLARQTGWPENLSALLGACAGTFVAMVRLRREPPEDFTLLRVARDA